MADLKLAKLPDRTPVKLSITITPDLQNALQQYAAIYAQSYGNEEPVVELIRAMLPAFLESDRNFVGSREGMNRGSTHSRLGQEELHPERAQSRNV